MGGWITESNEYKEGTDTHSVWKVSGISDAQNAGKACLQSLYQFMTSTCWCNQTRTTWISIRELFVNSSYELRTLTTWKLSKYSVVPGSYFPVFSPNTGKYGPEITPYLDTFQAVSPKCGKSEESCSESEWSPYDDLEWNVFRAIVLKIVLRSRFWVNLKFLT